ncbi:MAG: polyphosphate kinase 2 [Pseudomonadales bacterium]|nr:polyphosphate kinase 2 [Pseudomonadales bacterium]
MKLSRTAYKKELHRLQIELVKLQRHIISHDHRILVIFEGRDASGKDGVIKRIIQHLSPRETRVVAPGKPTERENRAWYFQRYVTQLPIDAEMVLFNRSWYNRAGVEKVMAYCSDTEYENFMATVIDFEQLLIRSGVNLLKYYLDISHDEQQKRLAARKKDPLKQWKISPVDEVALAHWQDYSQARNEMLTRTSTKISPWVTVRADHKKLARIHIIRDILSRVECPEKDEHLCQPDPEVLAVFKRAQLNNGWLAP